MKKFLPAMLLFTAACGADVEGVAPAPPERQVLTVRRLSLVESTAVAVDMWGLDWRVVYSERCTMDWCVTETDWVYCGTGDEVWGCTDRWSKTVWIDEDVPRLYQASVIAHELGHVLGLEHEADGIMNPDRSIDEFLHPTVAR